MAAGRRRAVVVGGSLGGVISALLLHDAGFDVTVHERSARLADRGAGIIAHPESLRYLVDRGRCGIDEVSFLGGNLRYLDRDGGVLSDEPSGYRFTSWFALHARLLDHLPHGAMHFAESLDTFSDDADGVTVRWHHGGEQRCELLVCADGVASTSRARLLPDVVPVAAAYIGWRGTVPVGNLTPKLGGMFGDDITYQLLDSGHVLVYPIPASKGAMSTSRFLNWIWYRPVDDEQALTAAMTDGLGRHHDLSVPPGMVASSVEADFRDAAYSLLAPALAALVRNTAQPFIQRIVDVEVPRMAFGRVCLVGDAAFVARPHAAAGTAKAAADGWSLAESLAGATDITEALRRWEPGQLALGQSLLQRSRELGEAQLRGDWVAGDRRLLFGLRAPGDSCFDRKYGGAPRNEGSA